MAELDLRSRLALALDVDHGPDARALADSLAPWFGVVKVGLELFTRSGPTFVSEMQAAGFEVFLDLKLHDIPTTVRRAATAIADLGVRYTTFHAAGGVAMLEAGMLGLQRPGGGAVSQTVGLAVTVLTSDTDTSAFDSRLASAVRAGMDGVVCSAHELGQVAATSPELIKMVPGVRLPGTASDDQARVATPLEAMGAGASVLVIGRTVTADADPPSAAQRLWDHLANSDRV